MAQAQTMISDQALPQPCVCPIPEKGQLPEEMYWAARHGLLDKVKTWLKEGGDVNAADHEGDTMMRGACRGGQDSVLRELMSNPNLHLNVRDADQRTPLMKAARRGQQTTISLLCAADLKCKLDYTAVDRKGNTALSLAVSYGHWDVALILMQQHRPYDKATLNYTHDLALKLNKTDILKQMSNLGYNLPTSIRKIPKPRIPPSPSKMPGEDIPEKFVYKRNEDFCRGRVCILNYKQFWSSPELLREGSEIDFRNLENLFTNLQYEVQGYWNLTKDMTLTTLNEFSQEEHLESADCAIVVIMSHGKSGPFFQTSDMKDISVTEIINIFLDYKCPHLKGKPKIFLFNFCRGPQESVLKTDNLAEPPRDILCVYSTTESFVSYRDPVKGSPFITTLCDVITKHHKEDHFEDILKYFNELHMEEVTPDFQNFRFQKKFYF